MGARMIPEEETDGEEDGEDEDQVDNDSMPIEDVTNLPLEE